MFYISNICCLCLKTTCDLYKNVRDYDDGNVSMQETLSFLPAVFQHLGDNNYKLCPDCYKIIKIIYDFTTNSVRCLNIFQNYLKQLKSSKNSCMFKLSVKLRDVDEDVDSLKRNEEQTTSTEDVEDSNDRKVGMYFPNDDVTTSSCYDLQSFEHCEKGQHSVKTEIEDGQLEDSSEYSIIEAANTEQQHVTDREIKIEIEDADLQMECLSNEPDNLQLVASPYSHQYQELKIEIEEEDMKKECFPDEEDQPKCLISVSDNQGTFTCNYCKRAFTTSVHCQKHISRCRDRVYNQPFTSATSIPDKKPRLTNDGEKLFQCDKCDNKYKSRNGLNDHIRRHSGVGLHTCRECHKQFTKPSNLAQHLLIHTGEKPHKCTQCEAAFKQAGHLKVHMLTHTGARPHKCTQCGKSFTLTSHLTRHMRIHTGARPYQCTQCNKTFTLSDSLTKHMRTHTGENPYQCTVCSQVFTQSSHLKIHIKKHSSKTSNKQ